MNHNDTVLSIRVGKPDNFIKSETVEWKKRDQNTVKFISKIATIVIDHPVGLFKIISVRTLFRKMIKSSS